MPGAFGWKLSLDKKHTKNQASAKRSKKSERPPWNDTVNDLSRHRASPEEIERRHIMHQSKNAEIARLQLLEKRMSKGKNSVAEDNTSHRETNGDDHSASCISRQFSYEDDNDMALRLPLRYFGVPNLTVAPNYKLQSLYSHLIVTESQSTPGAFKPRSDEDLHFQWARQKTPAAWTYHTQSTIQAMNDTDRIQEVKRLSRIKDSKSSEAQNSLINVCKKLTFNREDSQSSETDSKGAAYRTSDSGDSESVSNFTTILLDTLTKVSQKCIQLTEEMEAERRAREKLQRDVQELKLVVNELTAEVIYLHGELGKQCTVHSHSPTAEPSSSTSAKKNDQEMSSSSSSSSSATSVIPSVKVDGMGGDRENLRKTESDIPCLEKKKVSPNLKKSMSETNYSMLSTEASNISLEVKFQPEKTISRDLNALSSVTSNDFPSNKNQPSVVNPKSDHSSVKGVDSISLNNDMPPQVTLPVTLPSTQTTAFMLSPPVQLDVSQTAHQRSRCDGGKETCHFCLDPQLALLNALDRPLKNGILDTRCTMPQESSLCSPSTCTSKLH